MEKQGSKASLEVKVHFIFKLCNNEVSSHISPLSSNSQESYKNRASAPIFPFKYAFMKIHFVYDEKCRKNMHRRTEVTQLAKRDNELCTHIGCLAGYSFI